MSENRLRVVFYFLGIAGAVVFFQLFGKYSPQASIDLKVTRGEVIDTARNYLRSMQYNIDGLTADAVLAFDSGIALYLETRLGLVKAHNVLRADTSS